MAVGEGVDAFLEGAGLGQAALRVHDLLGLWIGNAGRALELDIGEMQLLAVADRLDRAVIRAFGDIEAVAFLVDLAAVFHLARQHVAHLLEGVPVAR